MKKEHKYFSWIRCIIWNKIIHHINIAFPLLLICTLFMAENSYANISILDESQQQKTITGTVTDELDDPLPGVSVTLKGKRIGTITDVNGKYSLSDINSTDVLLFSFIGMVDQEFMVENESVINVKMEPDVFGIGEVVAIGYGVVKKSDLTGAVSSINSEIIDKTTNSRIDQALQGRAAGVQVTQVNGAPGAGTAIRIRGGNSITGSNEPLWVIDGIVVGTNFNLNNINSNDINSIEILKDASSIAIYGSRGANGVILVTTKGGTKGETGTPTVKLNLYTSTQMVPEKPHMLSQEEQIAFTNESARFRSAAEPFPNDPSTYPDNDWYDLLMDNSPIYNADISISGASDNVNYYNSFNYFNQDGIIISSGIEKYIFRSNLDIKISEKFKTGFRINYSRITKDNGVVSFGNAFATLPTQPIYKEDGMYNGYDAVIGAPWSNPIANAAQNTNETYTNNLLATAFIEFTPSPKWLIRSTFNPEFNNTKQNKFVSSQSPNLLEVGDYGNASIRTVSTAGWNNENTIQFQTDINDIHNLTLLGGASFQKSYTEIAEAEAFGITSDATGFNNLSFSDPNRSVVSSEYTGAQIVSFFGRINYNYNNKYLLTLVGRTDGSSAFAKGNQYQFYPSIAGAWKISEESFMQNQSLVSNLKLRASYGKSGNQAIGSYRTYALLTEANTTLNGLEYNGLTIDRPENPNLGWETTNSLDIALETSFLEGRIFTELNYYHKETSNLLLDVSIPFQSGFSSQLQNVGSLENKGWEFMVTSTNINTNNFKWKSTLTLSSNKNKILDLGDGIDFIDLTVDAVLGSGNTRLIVGQPVPVFTGVRYLGTWKTQEEIDASGLTSQVVGGPRFEDLNGDKIISTEDNVILGDPTPDLIFGFENSFAYKNWDLSFYFQGTQGNEVYNLRMRNHFFNRGETTKFGDIADRWIEGENESSDIPRAGADSVTNTPSNSEYVEDGSHIRLKSLKLSYNVPLNNLGVNAIKDATLYFSGSNLLLISDFRLIDPETSRFGSSGVGNIAQGYSDGEYPNPRIFTFGINVTF